MQKEVQKMKIVSPLAAAGEMRGKGTPLSFFDNNYLAEDRQGRDNPPPPFKKSKTTFEALCNILRALEKIGPAHERTM
jgi:hypothetical protein